MIQVVEVPISGKLNTDVDIQNLREGDYLDMFNVEQTNLGAMTIETPVIGTEAKYDLGEQTLPQNKQVRIFVSQEILALGITDYRVRLLNLNGQLIDQRFEVAISADLTGIKNAIKNAIQQFLFGSTFVDVLGNPFFDVTLNTNFSDFLLEVTAFDGGVIPIDMQVVTLQESLTPDMTGGFIEIAGKDINKAAFILSTTRKVLPTEFTILNVFAALDNTVNVFVQGIVGAGTVLIGSVQGTSANGIWYAQPISFLGGNTILNLGLSIFTTPYLGGGKLITNFQGLSQISHVRYFPDTDRYVVTRLIKSKRLGFTTQKQPKLVGEDSIQNISIYFTDFYNPIRALYYRGNIVQDGYLGVFNSANDYTYESIDEQSKAISNYSDYIVEVLFPQVQTGGALTSGTKRYNVRFLTSSLTVTDSSNITQPVDAYEPNYENIDSRVFGTTTVTTKINRIKVSNILPNTFQFVELICNEYVGSATETVIQSYVVRRETLNPDQTEIILEHNGSEQTILLQTAEVVQNGIYIDKVKSIEIVNNKMVYGYIKTAQEYDLTEFIETFNYSIVRDSVQVVAGDKTFGQFYDVENIHKKVGYMPFEWYRFHAVAKFRNNQISRSFFFVDARIVPLNEYNDLEFISTNKRDRRDSTQDQFLAHEYGNNGFEGELYQYGLKVIVPSWDFLIDGVPARELIETIYITRRECIPEVLGSGILPQIQRQAQGNRSYALPPTAFFTGSISSNIRYAALITPDWLFNQTYPNFQSNDELIVLGKFSDLTTSNAGATDRNVVEASNNLLGDSIQRVIIEDSSLVETGGQKTVPFPYALNTNYRNFLDGVPVNIGVSEGYKNYLMFLSSEIENFDSLASNLQTNKLRYAFYFRARNEKYGQITQGQTFFTGAEIRSGESDTTVFGGDTYNQKTTFKQWISAGGLNASGLIFFSHNRTNTNLRTVDLNGVGIPYGAINQNAAQWLQPNFYDQITRSTGYTNQDRIQSTAAYNPFEQVPTEYPTRKYYSLEKPINSIRDNYRNILPLNFNDSKLANGSITELLNRNERLYTIQQRGITVEYFDGSGRLVTSDSGEVVFGDGSAFAKTGDNLSNYGTEHQFAVVTGRTMGGKDVNYYIDTEQNVFIRSGQDGTRDLGMVVNMNTYFQQRMRFIKNKFIPTSGQGLTGAWNSRLKQVIFTARGWKDGIESWQIGESYSAGETIFFQTYQDMPIFYLCLVENVADTDNTPIERTDLWERIPFENPDFYSVWTLVFSELKNAFTHRVGIYPKIYHTHQEHLFQPNPDIENEITRFGTGEELVFFGEEQEGFSKRVINDIRAIAKKYIAVQFSADFKPLRMEFEATYRSEDNLQGVELLSVVNQNEMEMQQNMIKCQVTNDFDGNTSLNDLSGIRGIFATIKTFYQPRVKQRLRQIFVKLRTQFDNYKS